MQNKEREKIRQMVDYFADKQPSNQAIADYCSRLKIEPIVTKGELEDYTVQVEYDKSVSRMFPKILVELQALNYIPEFDTEENRKALRKQNEEVRIKIAKIFESEHIQYHLATTLGNELATIVSQSISEAGQTVFNKALNIMLHLAHQQFGAVYTVRHAAEYAEKIYAKKNKEKELSDKKFDKFENKMKPKV